MKNAIQCSVIFLAACFGAQANSILTLNPPSGSISGVAGTSVGWGFTLTSDPNLYISVVTSSLISESNPGLGVYSDSIGLQGGPSNGVLAPGAPSWTEPFNLGAMLGVGSYAIDPSAPLGALDSGMIDVQYQTFSGDPNICTSCSVGFVDLIVPFSVSVVSRTATVPEPSAFLLFASGGCLFFGRFLKRRR